MSKIIELDEDTGDMEVAAETADESKVLSLYSKDDAHQRTFIVDSGCQQTAIGDSDLAWFP